MQFISYPYFLPIRIEIILVLHQKQRKIRFLLQFIRIKHHAFHVDNGFGAIGFVHNLLELIVSDDVESVHRRDACALTIGES